jgi:starch phosphorylase
LDGGRFQALGRILLDSDHYFHCADYASYLKTQDRVSATYARPSEWSRQSILNVAGMGKFSIDRTVREYAREIWKAGAFPVALPYEL